MNIDFKNRTVNGRHVPEEKAFMDAAIASGFVPPEGASVTLGDDHLRVAPATAVAAVKSAAMGRVPFASVGSA
jgi:hypothetical protein